MTVEPTRAQLTVAAGVEHVRWHTPVAGISGYGVTASVGRSMASGWSVEVGIRRLLGRSLPTHMATGFEGYGRVSLDASHGRWRPAIGLEAGASGATDLDWEEIIDEHWEQWPVVDELPRFHGWVGVHAVPARFQVRGVTLSTAEVGIGASEALHAVRLQVTLLSGSMSW